MYSGSIHQNRRWQRKMEQSRRSVPLSLIQVPELLDPAFVSLLQHQLSDSTLKFMNIPDPVQSHLSQFYIDCLDQTCLRGQRVLQQYFL